MRKSEIIKQRDQAIARSKSILSLNENILALNDKVTNAYIKSVEENNGLRARLKEKIDLNVKFSAELGELREQIRKLERKETSFQEDLEFFVNDCTEAQARELYERLKMRIYGGPHVRCENGTIARVGDTVQVVINSTSKITSDVGVINSILFENGKCVRFDLKFDNSDDYMRVWPSANEVRVLLLKRREEKG